MKFFRAQHKGISLEQMKSFQSEHEGEKLQGVACTLSANGLEGGSRFGGAWDALSYDDEIVVFEGRKVASIYDGFVAMPVREIARFTLKEWEQKLNDGSAYEYEN